MTCRKCGVPTRRRLCRDCELFERHDAEHTFGGTGSDAPDEDTDIGDAASENTDTESTHD